MNNDYKIMQLINHGIYVITNEFDKILITPCSLGDSASHENNNHVVLCHKRLHQRGNGERFKAVPLGWKGSLLPRSSRWCWGAAWTPWEPWDDTPRMFA